MKDEALKLALQNAVLHGGRAAQGAVVGKLLAADPKRKKDIKAVAKAAADAVADANTLSPEDQRKALEKFAPELLEKRKGKKHELAELKNAVMGKVVTRIPPEPSKYAHIGHALSFLINAFYAEKYDGKCILRFEDTNPGITKQEYADAINDDIKYLGIKPWKTTFVSDDLPKMYAYAEQLIKKGMAYVSFDSREKMRELRETGASSDYRDKPVAENMAEWKNMLTGRYKEGEAVLQLRGDLNALNYVMRDPVIFRISFEKHFRQGTKYCVWPLYDFENAVEDGMHGVTHVLRSIEFGAMRVELQDYIKEHLGLPKQTVVQYGRFNVTGATTQGREIRELIDSGKLSGWDDPRLVTIRALRRRGIQPDAFRELAINAGLSTTPTTIDWTMIAAENRKVLDTRASRYFFIRKPEKIVVENAPHKKATLKLHPEQPERGARTFTTTSMFIVEAEDNEKWKNGDLIRLMDCLNFRKETGKLVFVSEDIASFRSTGTRIVHWLPENEKNVTVEVLMPDARVQKGLAEPAVANLKKDDIVQFVRFGFCRCEGKGKFVYCHD